MEKRGQILTKWIKAIGCPLIGVVVFGLSSAHAIILFRTGDPTANTTAPTNDAAGSGWNYEGVWGGYLGTPIAPHFFLSAAHIGQAGSNFVYQGVTYTIAGGFHDPFSDLYMWQVNETFPTFAPLYTSNDERGQRVVAIGRGTQRGTEFDFNGTFRGWNWGADDNVERWGENLVSDIAVFSSGPDDALYATFDQNGLPNECHFSRGDSGGAVFINDGKVWKLAGINYSVDGLYTDGSGDGAFTAALFDANGFYTDDPTHPGAYIQITQPTPTGFYATRISSKLAWIESVIDPTGIANADGIPNLLEYAKTLNDAPPFGYGPASAQAAQSGVALIYKTRTDKPALQYQLQQSVDLVHWNPANSQDSTVATQGNVSTINSTVNGSSPLFLRLQVTQQ
jgi:hypothetical protein